MNTFKQTMKGVVIINNEFALARWANSMDNHYMSKGYRKKKQGQSFIVKTKDLPLNSTAAVVAVCPLCYKLRVVNMNRIYTCGSTLCGPCSGKIDLTGIKFGRLIAVSIYRGIDFSDSKTRWICKCECGREVVSRQDNLISGITRSCGCIHSEYLANRVGENHPRWLPDDEKTGPRGISGYSKWKRNVLLRDGNLCVICGVADDGNGAHLAVHHLNSYSAHKEMAIDINNGITLCKECHSKFHIDFMGGTCYACTRDDFMQWMDLTGISIEKIEKIKSIIGVR